MYFNICHENVGKETAVFGPIAVPWVCTDSAFQLNGKEFSLRINLSISRTETRNVRFFPAFFVSIKFIKSVASLRCEFAILIVAMRLYKKKKEILSVRPSDKS